MPRALFITVELWLNLVMASSKGFFEAYRTSENLAKGKDEENTNLSAVVARD